MRMHSYLTGFVAALLAICGQAAPFAYIGNASLAKVSVIDTASNSVVAEVNTAGVRRYRTRRKCRWAAGLCGKWPSPLRD